MRTRRGAANHPGLQAATRAPRAAATAQPAATAPARAAVASAVQARGPAPAAVPWRRAAEAVRAGRAAGPVSPRATGVGGRVVAEESGGTDFRQTFGRREPTSQ